MFVLFCNQQSRLRQEKRAGLDKGKGQVSRHPGPDLKPTEISETLSLISKGVASGSLSSVRPRKVSRERLGICGNQANPSEHCVFSFR